VSAQCGKKFQFCRATSNKSTWTLGPSRRQLVARVDVNEDGSDDVNEDDFDEVNLEKSRDSKLAKGFSPEAAECSILSAYKTINVTPLSTFRTPSTAFTNSWVCLRRDLKKNPKLSFLMGELSRRNVRLKKRIMPVNTHN